MHTSKLEIIALTKPEFSSNISKSIRVICPVAVEIHTAVLTSLKHLNNTAYQNPTVAMGNKCLNVMLHMLK